MPCRPLRMIASRTPAENQSLLQHKAPLASWDHRQSQHSYVLTVINLTATLLYIDIHESYQHKFFQEAKSTSLVQLSFEFEASNLEKAAPG